MIDLDSILTKVKTNIGIEYWKCNDSVVRYGGADIVNFKHPSITPKSITALSELTLSKYYKGEWKDADSYDTDDIVKREDCYYIYPGNMAGDPSVGEDPKDGAWTFYDPYQVNIEKEFDVKIKSIISDIYALIKGTDQVREIVQDGAAYSRADFTLSNKTQIIRIVPVSGVVEIESLTFRSKESTAVTVTIIDLEYYTQVKQEAVLVNTHEEYDVNLSSKYGFLIRIDPDNDLLVWNSNRQPNNSLILSTRTDFTLTDIEGYQDQYFSRATTFNCEIKTNVKCDLTQWFLDKMDILTPYILRKLAHSYIKSIYYNGAARSNKYEANEATRDLPKDIYGDRMHVGSLISEINKLEKSLISKYGYGSPCFKSVKKRIRHTAQ